MACLLVAPNARHKGVLSITTPDFRLLQKSKKWRQVLGALRQRWVLALHHNWHPFEGKLDPIFDFHFIPPDQIGDNRVGNHNIFELDACNFVDASFSHRAPKPAWDLLVVTRAVKFKRPSLAIAVIGEVLQQRRSTTALMVAAVPPYGFSHFRNSEYRLKRKADSLIAPQVSERFDLLLPKENYPFPLSISGLASLYQNSRAFVHFAPDETRARTAAYAFRAGMPVVGGRNIASIIDPQYRNPPIFYEVRNDNYVAQIDSALESLQDQAEEKNYSVSQKFDAGMSELKLKHFLTRFLGPSWESGGTEFFGGGLDVRLGRSHLGIASRNSSEVGILEFLTLLETFSEMPPFKEAGLQPELAVERFSMQASSSIHL